MRALIQRVSRAKVTVADKTVGEIGSGMLIFVGISTSDSDKDIDYIVRKLGTLRIFPKGDARDDKFGKNIHDIGGGLLVIPQFTLYGSLRKGTKPEFSKAMQPESARKLFDRIIAKLEATGIDVQTGAFGEYMQVESVNDGPVSFMLSSDHVQ
ncbi:MAG: D-aminoacyl-tRNA deacylase [Candidatus Dojkabacteria bacterium]